MPFPIYNLCSSTTQPNSPAANWGKSKKEGVNEAGMELNKLKDAIKMFQKKIEKQGRVTNARDEEHLKQLIKVYKDMGGRKIKEGKLNEAKPYETILKQLGGNRFIAMTGAKNLGTSGKDLSFSIGRNAKRVTHVHIKLTSMDLYDVEFINMRGAKRKVIKKVKGVYGDMLPKIFQKYTGMRTRL